jgi:G6PDH family F420-dependent oxidoreductase
MSPAAFKLGYAISSEEHAPSDLVRLAQQAEDSGFTFALISDHYHPWVDAQGHSAFVWAVLGGIASVTKNLQVGTGVTAPIIRIHPAILAQAAATLGTMMEGRFFFGVGTGENLNEHILADRWPPYEVRIKMLEEAIEVIRLLWQGGEQSHEGKYYRVENARVYDLPKQPVPIMIAAGGPNTAELAGKIGDGLIATGPNEEMMQAFDKSGGKGKPRYGQITVCVDSSKKRAIETAHRIWPTAGFSGQLNQELATPKIFEGAAEMVTPEMIAENIICGNDVDENVAEIQKYADAGFDHIYIHQVGSDQETFFEFYQQKVMPKLGV